MKMFIIKQTERYSLNQVARMFGVSVNNVSRWKKNCNRKKGAGRKVTNSELEKKLIDWIQKEIFANDGKYLTRKIVQ